jgi:hypothetical protein
VEHQSSGKFRNLPEAIRVFGEQGAYTDDLIDTKAKTSKVIDA